MGNTAKGVKFFQEFSEFRNKDFFIILLYL